MKILRIRIPRLGVRSVLLGLALVLPLGLGPHPSLAKATESALVRLDADPSHRSTPAVCGGFASGVCFVRRGAVKPGQEFRLQTMAGAVLVSDCEGVGLYDDGSARALRIDAQLPRELAGRGALLRLVEGTPRDPLARLDVRDGESAVRVETAGISIDFPRQGVDLLGSIVRDGVVLRRASAGAGAESAHVRVLAHGLHGESTSDASPRSVKVVQRTPLRAVVDVAGLLSPGALAYRLRFTLRAGVPVIDLRIKITPTALARFSDIAFEIPFAATSPLHARFVPGDTKEAILGASDGIEALALDGQRVVGAREGKDAAETTLDSTARCGVAFDVSRLEVAAVASRLRPLDPRGIGVRGNGCLRFAILRSEAYVSEAAPLVLDASLGFFFSNERSEGRASLVREPLPALRTGDAAILTEALPHWTCLAPAERDGSDPLPKLLQCVDSAVLRMHGHRDYGDYRLGRGFANLEYDPQLAFQLESLSDRGDARHAIVGADMLRHFIACDVADAGTGDGGLPDGVPYLHGDDHRTYEFEPGHVFAGGLALGSLLANDLDLDSTVERFDAGLLAVAREASLFTHERDYAWFLVALSDLALRFGSEPHRAAREHLVKDLLATQSPRGVFKIDRRDVRDDGAGSYVASPWVTAGITFEALYRESEGPGGGAARIGMQDALAYLLTDARYENGEFAAKVAYDRDGEVVVERNGVADPVDRLMIAAGIGRAALALRQDGLLDLFDRETALACSRLKSMPLSANDAARALVAWRSIADTRARRRMP